MTKERIQKTLMQHGWYHGSNYSADDTKALLQDLGQVIMTTHVKPNPESKAMVTSNKALGPHTDHHKASLILWHCLQQSLSGGESRLIDSRTILSQMTQHEISELKKIELKEHKVFPDDCESQPMLEATSNGHYRIYYSFWLATQNRPEAFDKFRRLSEHTPSISIRMNPNDILIIDNRRMLHGRGSIEEGSNRHLIRYWIQTK